MRKRFVAIHIIELKRFEKDTFWLGNFLWWKPFVVNLFVSAPNLYIYIEVIRM